MTKGFNDHAVEGISPSTIKNQAPLPDISVNEFIRIYHIERHYNKETIYSQLELTVIQVNRMLKNWLNQQTSLNPDQIIIYKHLVGYLTRAKLELIYTSPDSLKEMNEKLKHKLALKRYYELEAAKYLKALCGINFDLTESALGSNFSAALIDGDI